MNSARFEAITTRYSGLRIAIVGDFCLDRYLEIDPTRPGTSIETGLPVHNVVNVRSQPGAAGTILNNLVALGVGAVFPVGFCGEDGEGFELQRALRSKTGVRLDHFVVTPLRRTFTYCKPLLMHPGQAPQELSRLDSKNWSPTPSAVEEQLARAVGSLAQEVDAVILMDQVDLAETGVVTRRVLDAVAGAIRDRAALRVVADSRRGLHGFPPVTFKMNAAELAVLIGEPPSTDLEIVRRHAAALARRNGRDVLVTLAEQGMVGATPGGEVEHLPSLPVRGEIDIVGAGDAVTANATAALAAGASLREAMELATAAASIVIHQLGTTGTASVPQLASIVAGARS